MPVPPVIQMYRYVMGSGGGLGNLLKASEEFQQTDDWVRYPTNSQTPTVNADSRPDPNGGTTADQVGLTANTSARLQQTVTLSASTEYTFSVYARAVSGTVDFRMRNVTLKDAEVKTATTTGPDGGGFTRFTYTFITTTAGPYELALQNDTNATAKDVIFWGAMLNQGGTALDYEYAAPTTGGSAPAPAYAGFGDAYGGATAYYSLRKFTEAETLNAIRVRRSSDDTEQDIGFDANGDLDSTALLAFVGTGGTDNGFVTTWYDQSGNGNDSTNATESEQPLVVSGGTLVEENSKAAIEFEHSGTRTPLDLSNAVSIGTNDFMIAAVVKNKTNQANNYIDSSTNGMDVLYIGNKPTLSQSGVGTILQQTATVNNTDTFLINFLRHGGSVYNYLNGGSEVSATDSTDFSAQIDFIGDDEVIIQEIIIFDSDQSANRTGIEGNINDHFDIYP